MKFLRKLIIAAAALALLLPQAQPAKAAASAVVDYLWLCSPDAAGVGQQNRRVVNPGTSGGTYSLNSAGCAAFSLANSDAAYFISQGYTPGVNLFSLIQQGITASTTSTTSTITLPANAVIQQIVLQESAGNAVTGGVDIGNGTSATAYASAVALGANALVTVADSALTRVYPATTPTIAEQILVACHTSCNSASVNITILYSLF